MRDYSNFEKYLDRLQQDIYPQPEDKGHSDLAIESIKKFNRMISGVRKVLDLGCGEGFCQPYFEKLGFEYTGVCLQRDFYAARELGRNVHDYDFSFLPLGDSSYDLLYSRHSLEHSPFPLLTLMEWHRVCCKYLALVLPAPEYWGKVGRNHYFVLEQAQWKSLFQIAGFEIKYEDTKSRVMIPERGSEIIEYWFLLEKL